MKNKSILLGSLAAVILGGSILAPSIVEAYRGDASVQGPNYSVERHQAMTNAFESNDYEAWKIQMDDRGRVTEVINADNFPKFAEAHRLSLAGQTEEAQKIREELGLGLQNGSGRMNQGGCQGGSQEGFQSQGRGMGYRSNAR